MFDEFLKYDDQALIMMRKKVFYSSIKYWTFLFVFRLFFFRAVKICWCIFKAQREKSLLFSLRINKVSHLISSERKTRIIPSINSWGAEMIKGWREEGKLINSFSFSLVRLVHYYDALLKLLAWGRMKIFAISRGFAKSRSDVLFKIRLIMIGKIECRL